MKHFLETDYLDFSLVTMAVIHLRITPNVKIFLISALRGKINFLFLILIVDKHLTLSCFASCFVFPLVFGNFVQEIIITEIKNKSNHTMQ